MPNTICKGRQSYVGTQVVFSPYSRDPVFSDIVGDIVSVEKYGAQMSTIDATAVSDTSGFTTKLPNNRDWIPISITVFTTGENLNRLYNQFFANNPTEDSVFCKMTIVLPKRESWTNVKVPVFSGFLSAFNFGGVDMNSAQQFTFEFTPCGVPGLFNGFPAITSIVASPTSIGLNGGDVEFTVTGTNLINNIMLKGFVDGEAAAEAIAFTTGSSTSQTATIEFPAVVESKTYVIKASFDGGNTYETITTEVTQSGT